MRKIYYHHFMKCGGTTLSRHLDFWFSRDQVIRSDYVVRNFANMSLLGDEAEAVFTSVGKDNVQKIKSQIFFRFALVYEHLLMASAAPQDFFRFTVLRDPVDRILSQLRHLLSTSEADKRSWNREFRSLGASLQSGDALAFFDRVARFDNRAMVDLFCNHYCRQACMDAGLTLDYQTDPKLLLDTALAYFDERFDFVGDFGDLEGSLRVVAAEVGAMPPLAVGRLNTSLASQSLDDTALAARIAELNAADIALFEHCRRRHRERVARAGAYNAQTFEAGPLRERLTELHGRMVDERVHYDLNGPLVGGGFLEREGAGAAECMAWTGATDATIYVPALPGRRFLLSLDIAGYMHPSQRTELSVRVDGETVPLRRVLAEGTFDRLEFEAEARREFFRLEIRAPRLLRNVDIGLDPVDARAKGVCVKGYGAELLPAAYQMKDCTWRHMRATEGPSRLIFDGQLLRVNAAPAMNGANVVLFAASGAGTLAAAVIVSGALEAWRLNGQWRHFAPFVAALAPTGIAAEGEGVALALEFRREFEAASPLSIALLIDQTSIAGLKSLCADARPAATDRVAIVVDLAMIPTGDRAALDIAPQVGRINFGWLGAWGEVTGASIRRLKDDILSALLRGDDTAMRSLVREFRKFRRGSAATWIAVARRWGQMGRASRARAALDRAAQLPLEAGEARLWVETALTYAIEDIPDFILAALDSLDGAARDALREAVARDRTARRKLAAQSEILKSGLSALAQGRYDEAFQSFSSYAVAAETDPSGPYLMAETKARQGDLEASIDLTQRAVALAPDNGVMLEGLAHRLVAAGRAEEAAEALRRFIGCDEQRLTLALRFAASLAGC